MNQPRPNTLHRLLTRYISIGLLVVTLSACSSTPTTDLNRLYGTRSGDVPQVPVILVHGALGSRLEDATNGKEIWPGSLRRIVFSKYANLKYDINADTLEPAPSSLITSGIARSAAGIDYYGRILQALENGGGYAPGVPGTAVTYGEPRYYIFKYDWRQDNVKSAQQLDAFIEQVRIDYGDPALKVDIVAHSMGGLITRYYMRYGNADVLNNNNFAVTQHGASRVRRVILLGTPNLGSIGALETLVSGYKIGLGRIPPEVVATFPSTYQVLPHAITNWFVSAEGNPLDRDQFSADEFWKRFQYSVFDPQVRARIKRSFNDSAEAEQYLTVFENYFRKHIERARRFSWSLTVPTPTSEIRFIVLGGDCITTPASVVVESTGDDWELRFSPDQIKNPVAGVDYQRLMLEPGDGTVTKASLLARQTADPTIARHAYSHFPVDYPIFLCVEHSQLTGNTDFQNNLLHALLSIDR